MTCVDYLDGAIKNADLIIEGNKAALNSFGGEHRPCPSSYRPELDGTTELDEEFTNRFQQVIGVLKWSIELWCIDIMTEVRCLSQHL